MRVYAVGDVHGQLAMLRAAHDRIAEDRQRYGDLRAEVIHLGDLCDRGPDTAGVMQFLSKGLRVGAPWRVLKGNHDALFAAFLDDPWTAGPLWLSANMGGGLSLASYGIRRVADRPLGQIRADILRVMPRSHRVLLETMELHVETDDLILVHAGLRPGVPLAQQTERDLTWIREPFLSDLGDHGKLVVHGHTPVEVPMHCGNRVNLDTGAGIGRPLTVAVFEGRDCFILTDNGRVPLLPEMTAALY